MKKITLRSLLAVALLALAACGPSDESPSGSGESTAAGPAEAPGEAAVSPAPDGRLPEGVRPTAYRLDLLLDPRRDDFSGSVEIDIQLDQPAEHIWMHGKDLRVSEATAVTPAGEKVAADYEQVLDSGVVRVSFARPLPAGEFTLRLQYSADFDRNLAGLFKVEEQGESYALAKSESIQARKYLPGFDEPGLKAPFDISLTIPEGYVAISNGPEAKREPAGDGLEKVTFATTRPTPTYLLSLAVGPFDVVERPAIPANEYRKEAVPLRGFARKGRGDDMAYILDVTPRMLEIFEQELQRPYPFEKLDIIAAPQWPSGATELSAAITYREQRILVEGDEPAPGARLALLGVHAHELAHMWFGNLVTPPWWDDLWLKEGFATWGTPLSLTIFEPEGGHELNAAVRAISAMQLDSLDSTRAIREPIDGNDDIRNAYDSITYAKSLAVIHMVDQYFGPDRFRPALGRYVETFADGVADSEDFYRVIGEETNTPELTDTFRSFVEQKGVPVLTVNLECETAGKPQVTISQDRYRPLGSPIQQSGQRWTIPLCLRTDRGRQCLMLAENQQTVPLEGDQCPNWLLPNADGSGYYRWNFAGDQWQPLVEHFADLTATEQLSVIDSAFAAFEAGELPVATLLGVVRASAAAERRQVITAALGNLAEYRRSMLPEKALPDFSRFLRELYQPVLDRTAGSSDAEEKLLHSELLAFMALVAEDRQARGKLAEKATAFTGFKGKRDPAALDSDLYEPALVVAVQDAGDEFLPHLVRVRGELDDPRFDNASANAIGAANKPEQAGDVQKLALSNEVGPREAFGLIASAMAEPAVQEEHWQWLQENFPAVIEKIPGQWRRRTPAFARTFCNRDRLHQLRDLFDKHGDLAPGHQRSLAQTAEAIDLCIAQREQAPEFVRELSR
ncbi:M1 family metallopeptidase [Microbulbifer yueqingensis]|uniref:Aminopeptidase n=1 Tax=Microbulbifer yueqingensis TaxID=658219 RepID=A0A1G9DNA8_9GAMM|nr:M1 family metallopeptidase [Microbulbifer yueqingensis]SDK65255.1 alanyl aminopeptidase [Microbulbifer yueqingensis]